jgi:tetratricopeptide (TPR) repeat protein
MRTIRILYFVPILLLSQLQLKSQETAYYGNVQKDIDVAKELYSKGKYISTFHEFHKIQKRVDKQSELYSEAEYFKSVSALKAGYTAGNKMLTSFTKDYAESPYINNAWFNLGDYQFEKKQYAVAIKTFSNVKRADLSESERIKISYQNGYANLATDNLDVAAKEFSAVKDVNSIYSKPATYYWAHIMYLQENFAEALEGFKKLNNDPAYSKVIPLYVSHIYYKQKKYSDVVSYTAPIINQVEEEHKNELSKIVGDSYFHLGQYNEAIPYLETFYYSTSLKTREENYVLGYCYYITGSYFKAAPLMENASKGNDEMAQNAYYHLADCYIKTNEKEKAKMAYDAASKLDFNAKIKEDALFNYAKLTYELSFSPFNETIKAFDKYIELYPNSEHNAEAYRILSEVYMATKNYKDAITSIEKIKTKTPTILKAYQRVTYYRGLELFNNLAYNQSVEYFDLSLENGSHDRSINALALFWKGEALYRVGNYNGAINSYTKFISAPGTSAMAEYSSAEYNLAYSYFKIEDFGSANNHFKKYLAATKNTRTEKQADALNRIGDFYFLNTDYTQAIQNYQQAFAMKIYEADYSLFQIALCKGLLRNQQGKIENLEQLLSGFPDSHFQDDALYELGRAYERLGENQKAISQYNRIISNHKQSAFYRKSLLQLGLINYNNNDFNKALAQYKEVVEKFPETPEAQAALMGIKNCYIELNNVEGYFAFAKQMGTSVNVSVNEQDSLSFMAAERMYMAADKNAAAQLERYLQQFPNGGFTLNSRFYLAELLYKEGKYSEANRNYSYVAGQPVNIFSEQALSRASELTYNAGKYDEALDMFNRLESIASGKWNILRANVGQMRCYLIQKNFENAIAAAGKVKKSEVANEAMIREANFTEGKSYYETGNLAKAMEGLKSAATDVKFEQGAEAKYLVSEIYYRQKSIQKSEDEILDFISKNTPYQYWLGKSFLLLADIYLSKGDQFQAKHTLKSMVENYNNDTDGIKADAAKKLLVIENEEKSEQQRAIDNSFQIKIKEQ